MAKETNYHYGTMQLHVSRTGAITVFTGDTETYPSISAQHTFYPCELPTLMKAIADAMANIDERLRKELHP